MILEENKTQFNIVRGQLERPARLNLQNLSSNWNRNKISLHRRVDTKKRKRKKWENQYKRDLKVLRDFGAMLTQTKRSGMCKNWSIRINRIGKKQFKQNFSLENDFLIFLSFILFKYMNNS